MENKNIRGSLIKFPCDFLLKVAGKNEAGFEERIIELLKEIDPTLGSHKVTKKLSETNKFISLSVYLFVTKQDHVDNAYILLKSDKSVLWGL